MNFNQVNPQSPSSVVMVRPYNFVPNPETAIDNAFQILGAEHELTNLSKKALAEFNVAVDLLERQGIQVHVFDDNSHLTPDSVFPNNWFSTHPEGSVAIYPMFAANRRHERRNDIIEMLKREYKVWDVIDYSAAEHEGMYLEGTGAMVIDHLERTAYMITSNRADPGLFELFCAHFNYKPVTFNAIDSEARPIYHTNVFMSIATDFAVLSSEMIPDLNQRSNVRQTLENSGRKIIDLTPAQVHRFAGNCIELTGHNGKLLALSRSAYNSLTPAQISTIEQSTELLPLQVDTIEMAGGSVRCMIAGIHLSRRRAGESVIPHTRSRCYA